VGGGLVLVLVEKTLRGGRKWQGTFEVGHGLVVTEVVAEPEDMDRMKEVRVERSEVKMEWSVGRMRRSELGRPVRSALKSCWLAAQRWWTTRYGSSKSRTAGSCCLTSS